MAVDLTSGPEVGLLNLHFFNICRHHPTLKFNPHATDDKRYVWGIDVVPLSQLTEAARSSSSEERSSLLSVPLYMLLCGIFRTFSSRDAFEI